MALITLITDFGLDNWFVGAMKGVIRTICPTADIIDISHGIKRFNVHAGAFALKNSYSYFPDATIHVVVVDPGVGSARPAIMVQTERFFFIAPDNGVLSYALQEEHIDKIIRLKNRKYFLAPISSTFHGRDIFAPVAAHLASGIAIDEFGPAIEDMKHLTRSVPHPLSANETLGNIIFIDNFGNAVTNISRRYLEQLLPKSKSGSFRIAVRDREITKISSNYSEGSASEPIALIGSSDYLEIAVNQGSASEMLGLKEGTEIIVRM